jgi:hypothetical protein
MHCDANLFINLTTIRLGNQTPPFVRQPSTFDLKRLSPSFQFIERTPHPVVHLISALPAKIIVVIIKNNKFSFDFSCSCVRPVLSGSFCFRQPYSKDGNDYIILNQDSFMQSDIFPPSHVVDVLELTSTILCSSSSRRLWMVAISHVRGVKVPATNLNGMV